MSSIVSNIYQFIGRRSSTWALVLITGGMGFEVIFDRGVEKIFDTVGKGVSLYEIENRHHIMFFVPSTPHSYDQMFTC